MSIFERGTKTGVIVGGGTRSEQTLRSVGILHSPNRLTFIFGVSTTPNNTYSESIFTLGVGFNIVTLGDP